MSITPHPPCVAVTGATGFLGTHTAELLLARGAHVRALVRPQSSHKLAPLCEAYPNACTLVLIDRANLTAALMDCDAVVHTACIYGRGSETAAEVHAANVEFAQQVLEASALAGVPLFIACDTTLPPEVSAYAAAKAAFRQILAQSIAPPVRIALRLEHMYGPADGDKKLVTFLIRALLSNLPRIPLSAGTQLRDFVHISDVLEGIALLLSAGLQGRCLPLLPSSARHPVPALPPGFNEFTLGSGEAIRIRELAEHIKSLIPESGSVLGFGDFPLRPQEVMRSVSPSPELRALGWAPQVPLREGLAALVSHERSLFTPRA